jgi:hypothetical protein
MYLFMPYYFHIIVSLVWYSCMSAATVDDDLEEDPWSISFAFPEPVIQYDLFDLDADFDIDPQDEEFQPANLSSFVAATANASAAAISSARGRGAHIRRRRGRPPGLPGNPTQRRFLHASNSQPSGPVEQTTIVALPYSNPLPAVSSILRPIGDGVLSSYSIACKEVEKDLANADSNSTAWSILTENSHAVSTLSAKAHAEGVARSTHVRTLERIGCHAPWNGRKHHIHT